MPVRESIGLSSDSKVRQLGFVGETEPIPEVPPSSVPIRILQSFKGHQAWWDLDDTYNGDTTWFSGAGGTAVEAGFVAKLVGSSWESLTSVGPGVYTPNAPAPGTPYYPSGPVPLGEVGNNWSDSFLSSADDIAVNSGDHLAIIAYSTYNMEAALNPTFNLWESDPYYEMQFAIYENDGTTLMHDFGLLQIDLSSYRPIYPDDFPPGFWYPVSDHYYQSPTFVIP